MNYFFSMFSVPVFLQLLLLSSWFSWSELMFMSYICYCIHLLVFLLSFGENFSTLLLSRISIDIFFTYVIVFLISKSSLVLWILKNNKTKPPNLRCSFMNTVSSEYLNECYFLPNTLNVFNFNYISIPCIVCFLWILFYGWCRRLVLNIFNWLSSYSVLY